MDNKLPSTGDPVVEIWMDEGLITDENVSFLLSYSYFFLSLRGILAVFRLGSHELCGSFSEALGCSRSCTPGTSPTNTSPRSRSALGVKPAWKCAELHANLVAGLRHGTRTFGEHLSRWRPSVVLLGNG